MPNPYHAALREARRDTRFLDTLFNRYIGTARHPRGRILSVYRAARAAMDRALRGEDWIAIADALEALRYALLGIGSEAMSGAVVRGQTSMEAQVEAYNRDGQQFEPARHRPDLQPLLKGWMVEYDRQRAQTEAALATGETGRIVGDEGRLGILQPAPVARAGAEWFASALALGATAWTIGRPGERRDVEPDVFKQVIAALDERTTDCCLNAHAQIQPFTERFELTGTPRFADRMEWTPFHWYCRTSICMYRETYEDGTTGQMRDAARAELTAREETGERVEIHPATARSRR